MKQLNKNKNKNRKGKLKMESDNLESVIDSKQPPTTVREVGIHLVYMSRAMTDIKKDISKMTSSFATKEALADAIEDRRQDKAVIAQDIVSLDHRVSKIENKNEKIVSKIAYVAIVMLVLMVLANYGLETYFHP